MLEPSVLKKEHEQADQKAATQYAKAIKRIALQAIHYATIMIFLVLLNWVTFTGYWWCLWPALGFGLSLALQATTFLYHSHLSHSWVEQVYNNRLQKLSQKRSLKRCQKPSKQV
jgi:hypothetical protein